MAAIRARKLADGSVSYTAQIRIKRIGVQVYQESQTFARKQAEQASLWVLMADSFRAFLMGIVSQNASGFGSIREAAQIYAANELEPIQTRMIQLNDWLGEDVMRFKAYEIGGEM